jgi:sugar transferase (PEP-CTERM/EpsH1 system associated)
VTAVPVRPRAARLRALGALLGREPLSLAWYRDPALARAAARARGDVTLAFSSTMAPYARALGRPRVLDLVDLDSMKWRQIAGRVRFPRSALLRHEAGRLERFERSLVQEGERVAVVSAAERDLFPPALRARVSVIPNGVDAARFAPDGAARDPATILFAGALDYFPSADAVVYFARTVMPLVRARVPGARFRVAGARAGAALRRLAAEGALDLLGYLPDVRDAYRRAAVFVAPYRVFQGVPNKVLEALASGLPVVATPGAVPGLAGAAAGGVIVAEGADALARGVAGLLDAPAERDRRGAAGREWMLKEHRWEDCVTALERLLEASRRNA